MGIIFELQRVARIVSVMWSHFCG